MNVCSSRKRRGIIVGIALRISLSTHTHTHTHRYTYMHISRTYRAKSGSLSLYPPTVKRRPLMVKSKSKERPASAAG